MPSKKMTCREYVQKRGMYCPTCRSSNLEWTDDIYLPEATGQLRHRVKCMNCRRQWEDKYELCGYRRRNV